jgi:hypothetical protein
MGTSLMVEGNHEAIYPVKYIGGGDDSHYPESIERQRRSVEIVEGHACVILRGCEKIQSGPR